MTIYCNITKYRYMKPNSFCQKKANFFLFCMDWLCSKYWTEDRPIFRFYYGDKFSMMKNAEFFPVKSEQ